MEKGNIIMIGNKESGKTTYMISAYGYLSKRGVNGFSIQNHSESETSELDYLYVNLKNGSYPMATQKRGVFSFDLLYNNSNIFQFEWKDFNGGIIDEKNNTATQKLKEDMLTSSGLMLFFDSAKLYNNANDTKVRQILHIISQNLRSIDRDFSISIVLTKYDIVNQLNIDLNQLITPLQPLLEIMELSDCISYKIIPTSCTRNGFINVEIPILWSLCCAMKTYSRIKYNELYSEYAKILSYINKGGLVDEVTSFFKGTKSYYDRARDKVDYLKTEIRLYENLESSIGTLNEMLAKKNVFENFSYENIIKNKFKF